MSDVVIVTYSPNKTGQQRYLGPYQIAWYIRQHGFSTQVLDFLWFMTPEQRMNLYKKYITPETKILGYAPFITSKNFKNAGKTDRNKTIGKDKAWTILEEIKQNFPWLKVIVGGPFAENWDRIPKDFLNVEIDAVFTGQGEYTFLQYCRHVFLGEPHPPFVWAGEFKQIKWSREYDISRCAMRFEQQDHILPGESLPMQLSRGCIFKCKFCQYELIGKKKDDFNRDMDLVKEAMLHHYELFGTTRYHMADDTFNSHRQRTKDFHAMTQTLPFKIEYLGYVRMDLLDIWPEQQDILPESGLGSCHFGVETLDPDSAVLIGKGWGAKNYHRFLNHLGEKWGDNVILRCSLIAGLGKEGIPEFEKTEAWFRQSMVQDWDWYPLGFTRDNPLSWFDKNWQELGYRFPDPEKRPRYWENDYTDRNEAKEWCQARMEENKDRRTPGTWYYAHFRNIGYTRQELLNTTYRVLEDDYQDLTDQRLQDFIDAYYHKAMSYEPVEQPKLIARG